MSDHVMYTKPITLTDDKLRAAVEKQVKQRALKEALDKQIEQAKRCKLKEKRSSSGVLKEGTTHRYTFDYENGSSKFVLCDTSNGSSGVPSVTPLGVKRKGVSSTKECLSQQYNSLPPNFAMSTSESNPLAVKRPEYNTNSLPVDLEMFQANRRNRADQLVNGDRYPPRVKEAFSRVLTPPEKNSPRGGEYQTNCLPPNFNLNDVKTQFQFQQEQKNPPASGAGHPTPRNPPHTSASRSPRRAAGPLPPLELVDGMNAKRTPERGRAVLSPRDLRVGRENGGGEVRELKPKQPALRRQSKTRPRPNGVPPNVGIVGIGANPASRNNVAPTRTSGNNVELLKKKLESREVEMAKMREKERNWEEQVKRLKIELKNAKKKERDLNKLVQERPRRAETAPDQPIVSTPVISNLQHRKNGVGPPSFALGGKRQDFSKSGIFQPGAFRAITAPSETFASPRHSTKVPVQLPPLQESFKLASTLTCKTAFGLPEKKAWQPVPIEYEHLLQFVEAQIITQQQADELWKLFANEESPLALLRRSSAVVGSAAQSTTEHAVTQRDLQLSRKRLEKEQETAMEDNITESANEDAPTDADEDEDRNGETYETYAELVLDEYLSQEDVAEDDLDNIDD